MENKVKVWIARDKDNRLFAYSYIPNNEKDIWKLENKSNKEKLEQLKKILD